MADRWFEKWAPLPGDMLENVYFETWMGRLPLPGSVVEGCAPDEDMEEVKRLYVKPFTMLALLGVMAGRSSLLRRAISA